MSGAVANGNNYPRAARGMHARAVAKMAGELSATIYGRREG